MMKIVTKNDFRPEKLRDSNEDEIYFLKVKESLIKKNRPSLTPVLRKPAKK